MATLEITTIIGCKNMCKYCPQDKLLHSYKSNKSLTFTDFKTILSNVPKNIKIEFAGFSEAFLNPESSLMMKYAIEQGYVVELFTTLVGFTDIDLQILKDIKFKRVWFHQFDGRGQNLEEFNAKMEAFKTSIKAEHYALTMVGEQYNNVLSRAGNVFDREIMNGPFYCQSTMAYDHNVVLPNGDVYLCCMDWSLKHNLGNLFNTHFNNLNRQQILDLAKQNKSEIICRKCELFEPKYKLPFGIKL